MCRDATRRGVTLRYVTWHRRRGIVLGPLPLLQPHACVCVSLGAGRLFVGACRQDGRGGERGTLAVALAVSAGRTTPDPAARRGRGHRKTMTIVMVAVMMVMVMGRSRINCLLCCAVPCRTGVFFFPAARREETRGARLGSCGLGFVDRVFPEYSCSVFALLQGRSLIGQGASRPRRHAVAIYQSRQAIYPSRARGEPCSSFESTISRFLSRSHDMLMALPIFAGPCSRAHGYKIWFIGAHEVGASCVGSVHFCSGAPGKCRWPLP